MTRLRCITGWWLIVLACITTQAALAHAQQRSPQQVVEDLNRQAMEAYNSLDINKAGSTLEEAWRVATQGGVPPQLVARTSLNLGVVYVGGLGDQNNGLNYFVQAVCIDPNIQLDPLTSTPDIINVFNAAMQRARGGGCPTGGGAPPGPGPVPGPPMQYAAPQPVAPPPDQAFVHSSPVEQLSQTPLPLYVEISPLAQANKIFLYYKGLGMDKFKQVPMYRFQSGFAYQVSCTDVWEPKISYYIEAKAADGRIVGVIGSAAQPIEVPIVAARKQAEPSLPGTQAPTSCTSKECPPGVQGCKQKGKIGIGDACSGDGDCQSGLECRDDVCMLIGANGTDVPAYNPTTGTYEETSPPEAQQPTGKLSPWFAQLGLTVGFAYVQAGMVADRPPSDNAHIFVDPAGNFIADPAAAAAQNQMLYFPQPGSTTAGKLTAWVPDADSGDSLGPLQGNCSANGKPSGPGMPTLLPNKYCVRVKSPGFIPNLALRTAFGRFITPKISLAALLRFQFSAGKGTLSHMLIGARAEYMLTERKVKGLMVSAFVGGTFGEIQASPSAPPPNKNAPFVKSGLMGVHAGANFRYRLSEHFGLFAAPELDVQLPTFLFNLDLTLAGLEAAF
jgi:hypothetical protein